jgi:UDP-N-acetylmuramate dehydrogenase
VSVEEANRRLRDGLSGSVVADEQLKRHTSLRLGGPAALFIECATISDLALATTVLAEEDVEWTVLGKGSNVLASDHGYPGAVLVLGRDFKRHSLAGDHLKSGAGVLLAALVQDAFKAGLSGLEFAVGIPGTVGGALAMNAGTRDVGIGSKVESVTLFVPGRGLVGMRGPEVAWGYRHSDLPRHGIIVETVLRVTESDEVGIRRSMEASLRRRKRTQPLGVPSAGSTFVNPEGESAGQLIEAAGLKGFKIGGAAVSDVHANFIVNTGDATAEDIVALIFVIKETVRELNGIELKPEVRFLGTFVEP